MKRNTFWIIGAVILVVLLLFLPGLLGRGGWTGNNYGMMGNNTWMDNNYGMGGSWTDCDSGYGMMSGRWGFFGWLIPVGIFVLVVAGGVWLGNTLSNRRGNIPLAGAPSPASTQTCPHCAKAVDADWHTCPYCGTSLE